MDLLLKQTKLVHLCIYTVFFFFKTVLEDRIFLDQICFGNYLSLEFILSFYYSPVPLLATMF